MSYNVLADQNIGQFILKCNENKNTGSDIIGSLRPHHQINEPTVNDFLRT